MTPPADEGRRTRVAQTLLLAVLSRGGAAMDGGSSIADGAIEELAVFCHDLRQLVAAGLLLSRRPDDELLDDAVRERLESLDGLLQTMAAMIAAAEDSEGHGDEVVDLEELLADCARVVALNRRTMVATEVEGPALVRGAGELLRRALLNVLDNAARASGEEGQVRVRVRVHDEACVIEVSDDGPGWGRIGTDNGHGLATVALALQACEGRLDVVSGDEEAGTGTTVSLRLPQQRTGGGRP